MGRREPGTTSSTSIRDTWRGNLENTERRLNYETQRGTTKLTPKQLRRLKHKEGSGTHSHLIGSHTPNVRDVLTHDRLVDHCQICLTPATPASV